MASDKELKEAVHEFVIGKLWHIIDSDNTREKKLQQFVEALSDFFHVEKVSLLLQHDDNIYRIVASVGLSRKVMQTTEVTPGVGIAGMAIADKKATFVKKLKVSADSQVDREYKTDSFISYPLAIKDEIVGVLNITDKRDYLSLCERDIEVIAPIIERLKFILKH